MTVAAALLDSNVIIAIAAEAHEHHAASLALLTGDNPVTCALAAHSIAEAYATLTRRGNRAPFRFTAEEAWASLESLRAATALVGLTPSQAFDAVRAYAATGGIGPRLYDALIGQAAVIHGIPALITWNTRHMEGLFPALDVVTPTRFLAGLGWSAPSRPSGRGASSGRARPAPPTAATAARARNRRIPGRP